MTDRLRVYADEAGEWRWRLVAANGRTIASSGESFDSKSNALRAGHRATEGHDPEQDGLIGSQLEQPSAKAHVILAALKAKRANQALADTTDALTETMRGLGHAGAYQPQDHGVQPGTTLHVDVECHGAHEASGPDAPVSDAG